MTNQLLKLGHIPPSEDSSGFNAVIFTDAEGLDWSIGTGFSINSDGDILTAKHVINNADVVIVALKDGNVKRVDNIIVTDYSDVALLKVNSGLPPVKFIENGVSDLGTDIGFIGFPLGPNTRTSTKGSISAVIPYRYEGDNSDTIVYIINSFVNKGNSGGPVFSLKTGEVVGIMNALSEEMNGIAISTALNKNALSPVIY
ncbi:hypothetical protein LCGC14_0577210 [marine sediment metagenome]|uniref:Serine protease n=1 Tax=marine sediment metagenome TaxID=412755 RepID=A0A0F9RMK5_9ZZZZ|nr:serine protease [bacterium]